MIIRTKPQQTSDWREMLDQYKAIKQEFNNYAGVMSEYERSVIGRDIEGQKERVYSHVANGMIGEYKAAVQRVKAAQSVMEQEKAKEINRWDAGRLNQEFQAAQTMVQLSMASGPAGAFSGSDPGKVARLQALYQDAQTSGDIFKQRAAYELLATIGDQITGPGNAELAVLSGQAQRQLAQLRVTDGMRAAAEQAGQVWDDFAAKRSELVEVGTVMDGENPAHSVLMGSPYAMALRLLDQDRETGALIFRADDDPKITGIIWK